MTNLPATIANPFVALFVLVSITVTMNANGEWQLIEPAEVEIGPMSSALVHTEPLGVTLVAAITDPRATDPRQFVLIDRLESHVTRHKLQGIDADLFHNAYLRKLVQVGGYLRLVLASPKQIHVYDIADGAVDLAWSQGDEDTMYLDAFVVGERLVLVSTTSIVTTHEKNADAWLQHRFEHERLIDASPGSGQCLVDAVMATDEGIGVHCIDLADGSYSPGLSLEGYGLTTAMWLSLVESTPDEIFAIGQSESGQLALVCTKDSNECQVAQLIKSIHPGFQPDRGSGMISSTNLAISVRHDARVAEIFVHDLVSGTFATVRQEALEVAPAGISGWRAFSGSTVKSIDGEAMVLLYVYTETFEDHEEGVAIKHGLSVTPIVVSRDDAQAAIDQ